MTIPTFTQIKAQIAAIRQKVPQARVIGIRALGRWTGDTERRDGDQAYLIQQCDSPLAMRLALRHPADANAVKILITSLEDKDLSDDILLRLAKRRLFQIDPWQIVRSLFDAHAVDPRLTRHAWMAESLLEMPPSEGYPPARGGFLDTDTVWPLLLRQAIDMQAETPDLTALLKWSLDAEATSRFRQSHDDFRKEAVQWLAEKAGPVAETIMHCVARLDRPDAVPIGLAAGVIHHPSAIGRLEKATGKLEERYLGGHGPAPDPMQRWSAAATEVVRALRYTGSKTYRQVTQRADEILGEVQAEGFAYLSDTSPLGFDQRLARVGQRLLEVVERGTWDAVDELVNAQQAVRRHDQSAREVRRLERVDMALRLVRWLKMSLVTGHSSWVTGRGTSDQGQVTNDQGQMTNPQSFAEAANAYLREGGYIDWARLSLRSGDPVRELSEAYAHLFDRATEMRQQQSRTFARLLADWTAAGSHADDVIPVERILEDVVAPLAEKGLVLVIVIDGMSVAVCRELLSDITQHDWIAISEPGRNFNRPGLAAIPSKTEFSRSSLLCGALRPGGQEQEKAGFAEHPTLVARSRSGSPPVLFHKTSLSETEDTVLAAEVRKEIASTHRRVVGVVVNAVDDHLLKGEQIDTRWTRDEIKVLPALLHEARIARRFVVLVSDHGHVLDCQAEGRPQPLEQSGERWRTAGGDPAEDELQVQGSRVLTQGHRLIAPWSERVRYGIKKNGYHGGLTPQEMVIPIAVLSSTDDFPKGWSEQPIDTPAWWDESASEPVAEAQPALKLKPFKPQPSGTLFDMEDVSGHSSSVSGHSEGDQRPEVTMPQWVSRLLSCSVFEDQKRLGGRGVPSDEVFTRLLSALDQRGGKMTSVALARALEFPAVRFPGLLAKAERILNVDGYDVLRRDDASDTIELNRDLLLKQFDLAE